MPLDITSFTLVDKPVTLQEGIKILERDGYRCRYCGLDGNASFENALVMSVDFVVRVHGRANEIQRISWPAAIRAIRSRVSASTAASTRRKRMCSRVVKSCTRSGSPRRAPPRQPRENDGCMNNRLVALSLAVLGATVFASSVRDQRRFASAPASRLNRCR